MDLLNNEDTRSDTPDLLGRSRNKAIVSGDPGAPGRQLLERECSLPGEWDYLSNFRRHESQPPPHDEAIHRSLRHRLLVTEVKGQWRLRVPLMWRWLRDRG